MSQQRDRLIGEDLELKARVRNNQRRVIRGLRRKELHVSRSDDRVNIAQNGATQIILGGAPVRAAVMMPRLAVLGRRPGIRVKRRHGT